MVPSLYLEPPTIRTDYNFTTAICAIAKDAEAYLEEWLDFHLVGMGFQNIYLYDNSDAFDLKRWYENTRNHPVYAKVEVIHHPGNSWGANTGRRNLRARGRLGLRVVLVGRRGRVG